MGFSMLFTAHTENAQRCANGIQIRIPVTHNQHTATLVNQFHHRVGSDTGTHLAALLRFLVPATVEIKIQTVFDNCLVAAAAQGHFNGQGCEAIAFLKGLPLYAQAKRNGCGHTGGTGNGVDILQNGELILNRPFQVPFFKDKQVTVSLQPTEQAVIFLCPLGDSIVDFGVQGGHRALAEILGDLLVIVNEDNRHHGTGTDILIPHLIQLCQIREVQHAYPGLTGILGLKHSAVNPVALTAQLYIVGILCLAGNQPFCIKARQKIGDIAFFHHIIQAGQCHKPVIGIDNAAVCKAHRHHRKRGSLTGKTALLFYRFFHKCLYLLSAVCPMEKICGHNQSPHRQFNSGKDIVLQQRRGQNKAQQKHIITAHIGSEKSFQFLIQHCRLLAKWVYFPS